MCVCDNVILSHTKGGQLIPCAPFATFLLVLQYTNPYVCEKCLMDVECCVVCTVWLKHYLCNDGNLMCAHTHNYNMCMMHIYKCVFDMFVSLVLKVY